MSKSKKSSELDIVFGFLTKENRPFSVQNIVDALQKEGVKKAAVERSLAALVESGRVNKKEYGKAKIFLLAQDTLSLPDEAEVAAVDERIRTLSAQLTALNDTVARKRERIAALSAQYTVDDAARRLSQLRDELEAKREKRERLGDPSNLMSKEDKLAIDQKYFAARAAWKKYARVVKEIADQVGEATGKKRAELYEDIGVETDEEAGVALADFPEIDNPMKPKRIGRAPVHTGGKRQRLS